MFVWGKNVLKQMFFLRFFSDPVGFGKVREAGSFHASNFRLKRTLWCRAMTQKQKVNEDVDLCLSDGL